MRPSIESLEVEDTQQTLTHPRQRNMALLHAFGTGVCLRADVKNPERRYWLQSCEIGSLPLRDGDVFRQGVLEVVKPPLVGLLDESVAWSVRG
jgi:hypothetical protein